MPWEKTIWLIDGSSYIYRAFYALPPLVNSQGIPTGAIYGLVKMLVNLKEQNQLELACVALDPPGKTARHEMFEQYKANRSAMPEELKAQIPYIKPVLTALGFQTLIIAGEEADDIIGTLCKKAIEAKINIKISSPDKDFAQLVNQHIIVENNMSGKTLDIGGVQEKFGVQPSQIIDYLALIGDTADNIPGIPKVGPKTAVKWLNTYNSITDLIINSKSLKGVVGENFRNNIEKLELYQNLVTIKQDLDITFSEEKFQISEPDISTLKTIYTELGFSTLLNKLPKNEPSIVEQSIPLKNISELREIPNAGNLAIYSEDGYTYITSDTESYKTDLKLDLIIKEAANNNVNIIGFGIKPWLGMGLNIKQAFDVQLAQYIIDSTSPNKSLAGLANLYCLENSNKAELLLELYIILSTKLDARIQQKKLYYELEMPLMQVIYEMERNGILLDPNKMSSLSEEFSLEIARIDQQVQRFSEQHINLSSPKQIREFLFGTLNLPVLKKTAKGEASTSEETLTALIDSHPVAEIILQHRQLSKLLSTYTNPLPKMLESDGRLHGEFSQVVTSTGRLSSSNPNLQNIPIRSEQGRRIREAFIAAPGHKLISADYSQIELRIMAHLSQDDGLISAFEHNLDIHTHTASTLFHCELFQVTPEQRRKAKAINFGLIYGMSAFGLSKQIHCDRKQAQDLIDYYFHLYPGVLHYMETTRAFVRKQGYVETLMGRRLYLPDIHSSKHHIAMAAERAAINAPMQGTSADMIKLAMLKIREGIRPDQARILLQVHDELIIESESSCALDIANYVEKQMLSAIELSVPLSVNLNLGDSWGTLKPIKRSLI